MGYVITALILQDEIVGQRRRLYVVVRVTEHTAIRDLY